MVVEIIIVLLIVAGIVWSSRVNVPLREMNVGARLHREKRYAEAEAHFQQLLTKRLPPGIEADTRRRLALTLEVLGKSEEAERERERASTTALNSAKDQTALTAQGDLLNNQRRYDEACEMYQCALSLIPPVASPRRGEILAKLTVAHHQAGRSGEAWKCAEASLACRPGKAIRPLMMRMAGVAATDQGDLEAAETHYIHALDLSEATGKREDAAQTLGLLASLKHKQGHYEEAIAAACRSWEMAPTPARTSIAVEAECLRDMGRFEEARVVMRRHFDGPHLPSPREERKMQALGSLGMAWIETRAEQPDAAWEHLETARAGLKPPLSATTWPPAPGGGEDKLMLWCDATAVNLLSQQGNVADAHRLMGSIESRLPHFTGDYATLRGAYGHLARASLRMGDLAECRDYCQRHLECRPPPSGLPALYHLLAKPICASARLTPPATSFGRRSHPALTAWMPGGRRRG